MGRLQTEAVANAFDGGAIVSKALKEEMLRTMTAIGWELPEPSQFQKWESTLGVHRSRLKNYCHSLKGAPVRM